MQKAEKTIEGDLYRLVANSQLAKTIQGNIYRKDMRPDNATTEDCVVKFLSGTEGQIQNGTIILDVYVNDIFHNGKYVENTKRIEEIENVIIAFISTCKDSEYLYSFDTTPYSLPIEGLNQHYVCARIAYKRIIE